MATETEKYRLVKPDGADFYNITVQNDNMDKTEAALAAHDSQLTPTAEITTPADIDSVVITDSANEGKKKRLTWARLKAALGKVFAALAHGHSITDVTELTTALSTKAAKIETMVYVGDVQPANTGAESLGKYLAMQYTKGITGCYGVGSGFSDMPNPDWGTAFSMQLGQPPNSMVKIWGTGGRYTDMRRELNTKTGVWVSPAWVSMATQPEIAAINTALSLKAAALDAMGRTGYIYKSMVDYSPVTPLMNINQIQVEYHGFIFNIPGTPLADNKYGFLDVSRFDGIGFTPSSRGVVRQTFTDYATGSVFVRMLRSEVWTPWVMQAAATMPQEIALPPAAGLLGNIYCSVDQLKNGLVQGDVGHVAGFAANTTHVIGTIPVGFRPKRNIKLCAGGKYAEQMTERDSTVYFRADGTIIYYSGAEAYNIVAFSGSFLAT